jgi:hypothetical protein
LVYHFGPHGDQYRNWDKSSIPQALDTLWKFWPYIFPIGLALELELGRILHKDELKPDKGASRLRQNR